MMSTAPDLPEMLSSPAFGIHKKAADDYPDRMDKLTSTFKATFDDPALLEAYVAQKGHAGISELRRDRRMRGLQDLQCWSLVQSTSRCLAAHDQTGPAGTSAGPPPPYTSINRNTRQYGHATRHPAHQAAWRRTGDPGSCDCLHACISSPRSGIRPGPHRSARFCFRRHPVAALHDFHRPALCHLAAAGSGMRWASAIFSTTKTLRTGQGRVCC